jgi:ribulose-phosphate 3-epimerase
MKKYIIPAIIAKNQSEIDERIIKVKDHVSLIQLDVMDGEFVPNTSLDFDFTLPPSSCAYEAHLMVAHPEQWIKQHHHLADTILVHIETTSKPQDVIDLAKENGTQIGFVLNPETPLASIEAYLDQLDQVLIMTVVPGFYGSTFIPEMASKIQELRKKQPFLNIEVDGGITDKTISVVDKAGANLFVSGSYIVKADDVTGAIESLSRQIALTADDPCN